MATLTNDPAAIARDVCTLATLPTRPTVTPLNARSPAAARPTKRSCSRSSCPNALTTRTPFQGATVSNISPAVADELHLDSSTEGVVVTDLADDAAAANVGFQKGDIILAVNNQKITKTSDLVKATRESARIWHIVVVRGGQQINVTLGG